MVLVSRIGVSISPHSMTWVIPDTSPAPLRTNPPPVIRSMKMFPWSGRMAVTPVRTGPLPGLSGPSPRMIVAWPTRTPSTSVIALYLPGLNRPSGTPSSLARTLGPSESTNAIATLYRGSGMPALFGPYLRSGFVERRGFDRYSVPADGDLPLLAFLVAANRPAQYLADEVAIVDSAPLRDEHQVAPSGRQAGQRVALQKEEPALLVHPKIDPRHVSTAKGHESGPAGRPQSLQLRRVELGGHVVANAVVPLELVLEAVHRRLLRLVEEDDLHWNQDFGALLAQKADGELAAGDVVLDQRRLLVSLEDLPHHFPKLALRVADALRNDALGGTLRHRLHDQGKFGEILEQALLARGHQLKVWRLDPVLPDDLLRQAFVQRNGERGRIGTRIRDVEQLQQRGNLAFPIATLETLRDVENKVQRRGGKQRGQLRGCFEIHDLVAPGRNCFPDGLQRRRRVVLRLRVLHRIRRGDDPLHVVCKTHPQWAVPARRFALPPSGVPDAVAFRGAGQNGVDHPVEVQTLQRGGGVNARPGFQRWEGIHFQKMGLAVLTQTKIDPAQIAAVHDVEDPLRLPSNLLGNLLRDSGRSAHRDCPFMPRLQIIVVDLVFEPRPQLRIEDVFDRGEDAVEVVRKASQKGHRDVLAGNEVLHQDAGRVLGQRLGGFVPEILGALRNGLLGDSLGRALEVRFDNHRELELTGPQLLELLDELPGGSPHSVLFENELGELLVQGHRERVRVRTGIGEPKLLEERRIERLPESPSPAFRGVEDQVWRVGLEPGDGPRCGPGDFKPLQPVADPLDGVGQRVDRLLGVELRLVLRVREPEVERQGDAQRFPLPESSPWFGSSRNCPGARRAWP